MPQFSIKRIDESIEINLSPDRKLRLTPQELFQLTEQLEAYLREHPVDLESPIVKTVRKNGLEFRVAVNRRIDFWRKVENNAWEPRTFRIFDRFLDRGCVYIDIGAWIGPTVLYAAQLAGAAYAFEPDPVAYRELSLNLQCNAGTQWAQRVQIFQQAVDHQPGTLRIGSRGGGGDSMTSVFFSNESVSWEVEKISLADFFAGQRLGAGRVFIKMDIEGGEYQLLPRLRELLSNRNLVLYLSIHPWVLAQSLRRGKSNDRESLLAKIRKRLLLVYRQYSLFRSLPFRHFCREDGRRISLIGQSLLSILLGDFISTIVATHSPWEAYGESAVARDAGPQPATTGANPATMEGHCE